MRKARLLLMSCAALMGCQSASPPQAFAPSPAAIANDQLTMEVTYEGNQQGEGVTSQRQLKIQVYMPLSGQKEDARLTWHLNAQEETRSPLSCDGKSLETVQKTTGTGDGENISGTSKQDAIPVGVMLVEDDGSCEVDMVLPLAWEQKVEVENAACDGKPQHYSTQHQEVFSMQLAGPYQYEAGKAEATLVKEKPGSDGQGGEKLTVHFVLRSPKLKAPTTAPSGTPPASPLPS